MKKFKRIALALTFIFTFITCAEAIGMPGLSQEAYGKTKNKKVASKKKVAPKKKTTKRVPTKKTASKKKATSKVSAKKAAPKKRTTKKVSAKKPTKAKTKTTSKKPKPKKVTSKKRTTTKKPVRKKSTTSKRKSRSQSSRGSSGSRAMVVEYAKNYLGVPYVFGAASGSRFDCSGFTMYVYKKMGISLPHSASGQSKYGTSVSKSELMPGDLVFFHTYSEGISHVGIYIGDGKFIHASSGAGRVTTTSLSDSYYASRYRGATRLVQ